MAALVLGWRLDVDNVSVVRAGQVLVDVVVDVVVVELERGQRNNISCQFGELGVNRSISKEMVVSDSFHNKSQLKFNSTETNSENLLEVTF